MAETGLENDHNGWKLFLRKHWAMVVLFVAGAVLATIGGILVFLWRVEATQATGLVPTTLGLWTMSHIVTFIVDLIFWELLLIGIPVVIGAIAGWQWWKRLPAEEKTAYRFFSSRSRTTGGSGGVSILFFIAFCIKVFLDGKWDEAIASWPLDYVIDSMISILIWVVIIFGIPIAIGGLWWLNNEMKKKSSNKTDQASIAS